MKFKPVEWQSMPEGVEMVFTLGLYLLVGVDQSSMYWRGRLGSEAYADGFRWSGAPGFWTVEETYQTSLCVVDEFGELVRVAERLKG